MCAGLPDGVPQVSEALLSFSKFFFLSAVDQMCVLFPNSYVEALILHAMVFGGGAFGG